MCNSPRRVSTTSLSFALLASACLLAGSRRASAQGIVINEPWFGGSNEGGDVLDFRIDPAAARLAFRAETLDDTRGVLYLIPASGIGTPVARNGNLGSTGDVKDGYLFTPDGSRILYRSDELQNNVAHLYSALADGSGVPVQLSSAPMSGVHEIGCSPDGSWAVFLATSQGVVHVYSAPIAGGSPMVKLDSAGVGGTLDFAVSPDSTRVVYLASQASGRYELFVAPIDGSSAGARVNPNLPTGRNVDQFAIAPAGDRVAYRADQTLNDVYELYSRPIDLSAPAIKLNPALSGTEDVADFAFTPTGQVLYRAGIPSLIEVFRVPGDGSAPASVVNPPLVTGGSIVHLRVPPVGTHAVYRADQDANGVFELYSFPADGPGAPTKISGTMPAGVDVASLVIGPDGTRVAYVTEQQGDDIGEILTEVFTTATDGSEAPVSLQPGCPCTTTSLLDLHFSPTGERVAFRSDFEVAGQLGFYSAPADGSQPAERLNASMPANRDVQFGLLVGGGRAVYIADQRSVNVEELYVVAADGSTTPKHVNVPLFPVTGDVRESIVSPSGQQTVYSARQGSATQFEMYKARLDGTRNSTLVTNPLPAGRSAGSFGYTWDSNRILYRSDVLVDDTFELYSVPADGSGAPVQLNDVSEYVYSYQVGDTHVVYATFSRLMSVPPDGSQPAVQLTVQPGNFAAPPGWVLHRGAGRVAYLGQEESSLTELYSVPIDGSQPPVRVNTPLVSGQVDDDFTFSPDGATLVYREGTPTTDVLFAAPSDGSAAPIQLNAPLVAGGRVIRFWVSPAGAHVVYRADQETQGIFHLYAVPIDGSAAPLLLNQPLPVGAVINYAAISPDGNWVVYRSDHLVDNDIELYSVPMSGGTSTRLSHVTAAMGDVQDSYFVSPNNVVVFLGDLRLNNVMELFAVPVAGGVPEVRLHPALPAPNDIQPNFALVPSTLPGPERVLFIGNVNGAADELWSAPVDGSRPAHRESLRNPAGPVFGFEVSPQGNKVVFAGDQRFISSTELYLTFLGGPIARAR